MSGYKPLNILITDIDDVLLNWTASFDAYIRINHNYNDVPLGENPKRLHEVLNCSRDEVIRIMKKHNNSSMFGILDPHKDALLIKQLSFDKVYAITSCGEENLIIRVYNIKSVFGEFIDQCICLPYYAHKIEHIIDIVDKHQEDNIFMLDDNVIDVEEAINLGVDAYVYKSAFYDSKSNPMVENMEQFVNIISPKLTTK